MLLLPLQAACLLVCLHIPAMRRVLWELQLAAWPKYDVGGSVLAMSLPLLRAALAAVRAGTLHSGNSSCSPAGMPVAHQQRSLTSRMQKQRIRHNRSSLQANSVPQPRAFWRSSLPRPSVPFPFHA